LNVTRQFLGYADDFNLVGENMNIINTNSKVLLDTSKEVGLEMKAEKTNLCVHVCLSRCRKEA
jgi:hypothetical protein